MTTPAQLCRVMREKYDGPKAEAPGRQSAKTCRAGVQSSAGRCMPTHIANAESHEPPRASRLIGKKSPRIFQSVGALANGFTGRRVMIII
jgi:cytochrome c553